MQIFDRKNQVYYEEKEYEQKKLDFLYKTILGRILLRSVSSPRFSNWLAERDKLPSSVKKIAPFAKKFDIPMDNVELQSYRSFNDFFKREIKAGSRPIGDGLISPADAKLLIYPINVQSSIKIKQSFYTVAELIQDEKLAKDYQNGLCLVFRLSVDDIHHYIFCDSGHVLSSKLIRGRLHSVRPIAETRYKVFSQNTRICTVLDFDAFGQAIQIEVGALLVGKINNAEIQHFLKGYEKGNFELGGSTIVLLFKEDAVRIDTDILERSAAGIETKVRLGEGIGL
ncbi:MAG: phosphatidylserine decarboxylase [Streptococcaceae bacterium]|jgi:phosphatidylserine decarboxylase|nr:phosphatidylserine decarboxylase [Streptococcaceae bacterium]